MVLALLTLVLGVARAAPMAEVGEQLADGVVARVEDHPDYERVTVTLSDGRPLQVEFMRLKAGYEPACEAGGFGAWPRWELLGESREREDQPTVVAALCARLAERSGELAERLAAAPALALSPDGPDTRGLASQRRIDAIAAALGLAALLGLAAGLRRAWQTWSPAARLELAAVALTGLAARLALSHRTVFVGPDAGYEALRLAWGEQDVHPTYGGGFAALMRLGQLAAPRDPDAVFATQLGLAALAPPLMAALVRRLIPGEAGRTPALLAGLAFALLPAHLRLSATEVMPLPLPTVELGAALAALAFARGGAGAWALLAGGLGAFAAHIRPEAATFLPVPLAVLAWAGVRDRRPWPALAGAALGAGLLALRFSALPPLDASGPTSLDRMLAPRTLAALVVPWFDAPGPLGARVQVALNLRLTPVAPIVLALLAAWSPRRRLAGALLAWWALVLLPVMPKDTPLADALRLQLPAAVPALAMAGLGAEVAARWLGRRALLAAVVLPPLLWVPWVRHPWATHREWDLLRAELPALPAGATLLVADRGSHPDDVAAVLAALAPQITVTPMSAWLAADQPARDLFALVGVICRVPHLPGRDMDAQPDPCAALAATCALTPYRTAVIPAEGDRDLAFDADEIEIGLYRVDGCKRPDSQD